MRPTKEQKQIGIENGWDTFEVEHGYGFFVNDENHLLCCEKIDDMGTFESDLDAIKQAKKDGFRFIKILPSVAKEYDLYGVVDTITNRVILKKIILN